MSTEASSVAASGRAISVSALEKTWGSTRSLSGVDLEIPGGRFTAVLGPSGCGKSTLLRLIAGLDAPTAGRIRFAGEDVTAAPPAARRLAMVFQSYALFPHLTAAENIIFGLRVEKLSRAERDARLAETAELLGLAACLDRRPAMLSGGQQQRVALGRAVISRRDICLMDEPLSNLDARLRDEMRREIRALQRRLGMTMLYVTHDQTEALTMADRIVLMNAGKVEQVGAPQQIHARPATPFAARFIGAPPMNLLPASAFGERLAGLPESLRIGIRPEALVPAAEGPLACTVESAEFLGDAVLVEARGRGGAPLLARLSPDLAPAPGARLRFGFAPGALHLFDGETRVEDPALLARIAGRG